MSVRVRYAPSPTGLQHIGGIRTALFNYFFAKANNGSFILRIEDTDQSRYQEEALDDLYSTLKWLKIEWDEGPVVGGPFGPYKQSQRIALYQEYANKLVQEGKAYRCYCTNERLDALREQQTKEKTKIQGYDRHCRSLTDSQRTELEKEGKEYVIRFKIPLSGKTTFTDLLMGPITRSNTDISPDPIILKSDGFPTYHLANVIDDHFMEITHIMRAQEWIPSAPLHLLLYEAFGWKIPKLCHLPMVMGSDGQKLSKRHGSTAVRDFRNEGYLAEALLNYVSLVGWSYDGEREFFTKEELKVLFSLEKISKAPGVFDYKKLQWFNGHYIRLKSDEQLMQLLLPYLIEANYVSKEPTNEQLNKVRLLVPLVKERLKVLSDVVAMVGFLFEEIKEMQASSLIPKKMGPKETIEVLERSLPIISEIESCTNEEIEERLLKLSEELNLKTNGVFMPLRVALTGSLVSPPLLDSMRLLGIEKTIARIKRAITILINEVNNG
ncbi:MAG: glutamate--tRNA ligase [Sphaerochaetaceae bacterium]